MTAFELVWDSRLIALPFMENKKVKKERKERNKTPNQPITTRPAHEPKLPKAGGSVAADTTWKHPVCHDFVRRYLRVGVCACVSVCEPKPECQKDQVRRQEGEVLFGSHKSTFKWSSIPEHHRKWDGGKGWGGVWLEFHTALTSAALSSLGLFCFFFLFPLSKW